MLWPPSPSCGDPDDTGPALPPATGDPLIGSEVGLTPLRAFLLDGYRGSRRARRSPAFTPVRFARSVPPCLRTDRDGTSEVPGAATQGASGPSGAAHLEPARGENRAPCRGKQTSDGCLDLWASCPMPVTPGTSMRDLESGIRMTDRKRMLQGKWRRVVDAAQSIRWAQPHADG
jgi:hypothetical protein